MIGTIKYIADVQGECRYERGTWEEFIKWLLAQKMVQFDIETSVTERWNDKILISLQFGSCTPDRVQWFLQRSVLSDAQMLQIRMVLEDKRICKLIHTAKFEYIVMRFNGVIIENIYDTMLAEKVLRGGMEKEDYALADITWKYVRILMSKELQTSFGDNIITEPKIRYGITDVAYLDCIRTQQILEARQYNLLNVIALENEACPAFCDITYEGMILDTEKWMDNLALANPIVEESHRKMNAWLQKEPFRSFAIQKGYLSDKDRFIVDITTPAKKNELIKMIFPDIPGSSKPVLKKYIKDNGQKMESSLLRLLIDLKEGDTSSFIQYFIDNHYDYLVEQGYLVKGGVATINWNSIEQALSVVQLAVPKLKKLAADHVAKFSHPILDDLSEYKDDFKLITTYGEKFIEKYLYDDGKIRTNINQIVSTGRISCSDPNIQQITVKEKVGTRYRNAFICEKDWVMVDSDYVSQELVIIAYISKDPVWMEAIEKGWDLHSICAELVYKQKWRDAAEKGCAYYDRREKCNCKKHKTQRYDIKTINFGLAYGMSEFKLSGELKITRQEAINLISQYFNTFPLIGRTLNFLGEFGVRNGYIMTLAPFFRRRWFPQWREYIPWIDAHVQGIMNVPQLGEIERASKNQPIQGASADIAKAAMWLIRDYIRDNNLRHLVKFQAQVHDQITTKAHKDYAEQWNPILDRLMADAGKIVIPTGILKADTNITPVWTK